MKRIILSVLLLGVAGSVYALQPNSLGDVKIRKLSFDPFTIAQINALTPDTTNQHVGCGDCTQTSVCASSGTGRGAWVVPITTGTFVGVNFSGHPHCQ